MCIYKKDNMARGGLRFSKLLESLLAAIQRLPGIMRFLPVSVLFAGAAALSPRAGAANETQAIVPKKYILEAGDVREPPCPPSQIRGTLSRSRSPDANTCRTYRV